MEAFGIFGEKLGHSMSPAIYKILFEKYNVDATYSIFEIKKENFHNSISSCKTLNIKGVNITIPYKHDVISQLDELDDSVKKIGACNCVKFTDGKTKGYNTDYYGVLRSLKFFDVDIKGKDCVILGSGGASKSVITLFKDLGAKSIKVVQRVKSNEDYDNISFIDYSELDKIESAYMLVNTTPVGMYPNSDNSPVGSEIVAKFEVCFDAVYNPLETELLKMATEKGLVVINGLYMLVGQALDSFTIYTGIEVSNDDFTYVYREVEAILRKRI